MNKTSPRPTGQETNVGTLLTSGDIPTVVSQRVKYYLRCSQRHPFSFTCVNGKPRVLVWPFARIFISMQGVFLHRVAPLIPLYKYARARIAVTGVPTRRISCPHGMGSPIRSGIYILRRRQSFLFFRARKAMRPPTGFRVWHKPVNYISSLRIIWEFHIIDPAGTLKARFCGQQLARVVKPSKARAY